MKPIHTIRQLGLPLLIGLAAAHAHAAGHAPSAPSATAAPVPASAPRSAPASVPTATPMAEAEVRRIDAAQGRLQLRHGPIPNLDMPPMTMVFRVRDPALLDGLQEGDRIFFAAERLDGAYTVTHIMRRPAR